MPSSYTSLLRFELPVQGELSGTWGNVVNTAITTPVSEAIAGTTSISVGATDYTLSNGDGATSNEARKMFITATGSPGATRSVICPSASKLYVFTNSTSDGSALIFRTSGSGVTVPSGQRRLLYCDGTNVVEAVNGFGSLTLTSLTLGTALAATSGGTGQASYAVGDILYASSTTALSKLTVGATNAVLTVAAGIPSWVTTLPVASGGTGQTTAATAFDALKQAATDTYTGVVELATNAEALAGTDTTRPVTPAAMRAGFSASGSAPVFAARAWVNFNGVGTVAIRSSGNVTSITDNGTGDYTVNFTTAISDANYAVVATGAALASPGSSGYNVLQVNETGTPYNTSSIRIGSVTQSGGTPSVYDSTYVNVVVYR